MVIKIIVPNNNVPEREYIIKTLLQDFLNLECEIEFYDNTENYIFFFDSNKIIIEDHFFNKHIDNLSYLSKKNIPDTYTSIGKYDLPIIFGRDYLKISENEIICGLDVFASSFFLLTRWEEFVLPPDKNGLRCDESELFCVKQGLEKRPLVNEYIDMLSDFFSHFGLCIHPERQFKILPTHDVDRLFLSSFSVLIKNLSDMVFIKKLYKKALITFWRYLYYRVLFSNPFDSFNELMNISDSLKVKSSFYFKASDEGETGATYFFNDIRTKDAIENIINRGHKIGFHPSENTFNNEQQFEKEFYRLYDISASVKGGRQHNLLYNKNTFGIWDKLDLEYDSGYGFQYRIGFRCGICYDFKIFDVVMRREIRLKEIPFLLMDSAFVRQKSSFSKMEEESMKIIDIVKKYNGILCTVWHTNLFNSFEGKKTRHLYYNLMKYAVNG